MPPLNPERRRAQRFTLDLPIRVTQLEGKPVDLSARSLNVSSSGALMTLSKEEFAGEGDRIEFLLRLEGDLLSGASGPVTLRCRGRIVRTERQAGDEGSLGVAATIDRYQFVRT